MADPIRGLRQEIVAACRELSAAGLVPGTAGNVSVRAGERMLITPTGIACGTLRPEMIVPVILDHPDGTHEGSLLPSSEWRLHRDILISRPEIGAVVHTHAPHATALATTRRPIPACHYMVAAFGGDDVRCAGYARYGTQALSDLVVAALKGRLGCLMANHGMVTIAPALARAVALAHELEALARLYLLSLAAGGPHVLSAAEMQEAAAGFATYGRQSKIAP